VRGQGVALGEELGDEAVALFAAPGKLDDGKAG
jgi:hypothetical protein